MTGPAGMLARMAIFGVVTASDVAASAAQAQMYPRISRGQTFHASLARRRDAPYAVQMTTCWMAPTHRALASRMAARFSIVAPLEPFVKGTILTT
jgi:hypothetical protein